jgi:hypothetical protein
LTCANRQALIATKNSIIPIRFIYPSILRCKITAFFAYMQEIQLFSLFICIYQKFFVPLQPQRLNNEIMEMEQPKQMPYGSENTGVGTPQQKYFTADEAMTFLEPRIRAMFK